MTTKKKKKKTAQEIEQKIDSRRLNSVIHKMKRGYNRLPEGHSRRCWDFTPAEIGIDSVKKIVSQSKVVKNYEPSSALSKKDNKELAAAYYAGIRKGVLEEIRSSLQTPLVIPEAHNPEGPTTLDLSNLTSAGEEDADAATDS